MHIERCVDAEYISVTMGPTIHVLPLKEMIIYNVIIQQRQMSLFQSRGYVYVERKDGQENMDSFEERIFIIMDIIYCFIWRRNMCG